MPALWRQESDDEQERQDRDFPATKMIAFPPALLQQLAPLYQVRAQADHEIRMAVKAWAIGKEIDMESQDLRLADDGKGVTLEPLKG